MFTRIVILLVPLVALYTEASSSGEERPFMAKAEHHSGAKSKKAPSDDTHKSPTSSSDIPFLYGVSGKETFYIRPKLDTCKLSLRKLGSDESNTCVAAYAAGSCEKRADMDVTVYAVDETHWTTKEYDSTIIESDGKMQFDTLTAHGNTHPDLTKRLNAVKTLYELDTSIRNMPYGRDFFYGVREGTKLFVDIFGPDGKGYCRINDRAIPKGVEVAVFPAGRSLFAQIAREGSPINLMLNGFVRGTFLSMEEDEDEKADPTDPKPYWRGIEYENTPHLRQCDDLVKWYRDFA
ncbi:hypothetical protein FOZ63_015146 [Perkinsus olseni]|uniref:Uncharacterized protein n=1 Tax=Perkinsus olseni TaxID=32597 RepID=A0A7J6T6A7_PEROL|nr:hypothetical protein FOZ63_015146 [Perkinsus olseni]KAF4753472.1 hypothetical protein FOZ62_022530 [Perkinsus olseni]